MCAFGKYCLELTLMRIDRQSVLEWGQFIRVVPAEKNRRFTLGAVANQRSNLANTKTSNNLIAKKTALLGEPETNDFRN